MPDVIICGDTIRHAELRHEVPLAVPDPFLYAETGGERHVVVSSLEIPRISAVDGGLTLHPYDEFVTSGLERGEVFLQVMTRACQVLGVQRALVPSDFPVELADRVRAAGLVLDPDRHEFESRRRLKSPAELAGIRRAQAAANAGMRVAAEMLRQAEPSGEHLLLDGEPLTCERVKEAIRDVTGRLGASAGDELIVAHGAQTAIGL